MINYMKDNFLKKTWEKECQVLTFCATCSFQPPKYKFTIVYILIRDIRKKCYKKHIMEMA